MKKKTSLRPSILQINIVALLYQYKEGTTIKNISNLLKADYKNVYDAIEQLFIKGIIKKDKVGNYNVCRLNYFNDEIINYFIEYNRYINLKDFKRRYLTEYNIIMESINRVIAEKNLKIVPSIVLVFGSIAKQDEKTGSDIDMLILSIVKENFFENNLRKINAPYQKKFHINNQQLKNFVKDINNKNKLSIGKELCTYMPIIFFGDEIFFRLIIEVHKSW